MRVNILIPALVAGLLLGGLGGCESLPGSREQQSTVIGGAAGAATGALLGGDENRLVGALLGGALGAGGGYLIGARTDWFDEDENGRDEALEAIEDARSTPATAADVAAADTADLNEDGFVTIDELTAMEDAGLSDAEILARLRATGQVFDLSESQEDQLRARGISRYVVAEMQTINQEQKERVLTRSEVLGR